MPKSVIEEVEGAKQHYNLKERCIYCDIIRQETMTGSRMIAENRDFVSFAPFAPRFPFETWIMPKQHASNYSSGTPEQYANLALILQETLKRLDRVLSVPPYNYIIHTSPFRDERNDYFHWHIELMPKLTHVAGFEWGSGFYINPTPPEEAAKFLREAKV